MAVTTLRPMPHTEIDDSSKSELLRALCFFLPRSDRRLYVFASFQKEISYGHGHGHGGNACADDAGCSCSDVEDGPIVDVIQSQQPLPSKGHVIFQ